MLGAVHNEHYLGSRLLNQNDIKIAEYGERTFKQVPFQLLEVALLQTNLEMEFMVFWRSTNRVPFRRNKMSLLHSVARVYFYWRRGDISDYKSYT